MKIPNNVAHSLQNESGTTTIKSFRFSEKLLEKLSSLARKYGQSENQFVSNWLEWRVAIDPLIPTFDSITLGKETFESFLGIMNSDSLELLAWELGKKHFAKANALLDGIGEHPAFTRYLAEILSEHARWFRVEGSLPQILVELSLHHDYGIKWSVFLKNYLSGAWEVISRNKLLINIDDNSVKLKFPAK